MGVYALKYVHIFNTKENNKEVEKSHELTFRQDSRNSSIVTIPSLLTSNLENILSTWSLVLLSCPYTKKSC